MSDAKPKAAARSTRGKILMVIAAVILAGLGYVAWSTQKPRDPGPVVAPAGTAPASQPRRVRPSVAASRPALVPRPKIPRPGYRPPEPVPPIVSDAGLIRTNLTKTDIRTAQANLHRAADPCVAEALKAKPDLGLRMAIRYTLYVQGGEARAVNPRITKSLMNDPEVEKCIIDKITHAKWKVDATDGIVHAAESFNFKHLQRTHIE